jgi:hypothetical protein
MDGNLVCVMREDVIELHWQGKLRGPDFDPIAFKLVKVKTDKLIDSNGRQVSTVIARAISADEQKTLEQGARRDEDTLLVAMLKHDGASIAALAGAAGWQMSSGAPYKTKVARLLRQLAKDRMAKCTRGSWKLTDAGKAEAAKIETNIQLAGSRYG